MSQDQGWLSLGTVPMDNIHIGGVSLLSHLLMCLVMQLLAS